MPGATGCAVGVVVVVVFLGGVYGGKGLSLCVF